MKNNKENNNKEHLDTISEIKELIERSSRFRSLGGSSGIAAGLVAIAGAVILSLYLKVGFFEQISEIMITGKALDTGNITFIIVLAVIVLLLSTLLAVYLSSRNARRRDLVFWEKPAQRVFINHFVFLMTGGLFCGILLYYGIYFLIVPSMLIFYGLALINVSKFTFNEIAQLGIIEIILGIIASFIPVYPLLMWFIGFGILHLIYGAFVIIKYDNKES